MTPKTLAGICREAAERMGEIVLLNPDVIQIRAWNMRALECLAEAADKCAEGEVENLPKRRYMLSIKDQDGKDMLQTVLPDGRSFIWEVPHEVAVKWLTYTVEELAP